MGSLSLSYPALSGDTIENQIFSIKSYLYQLTDQLNLADWSAQKVLEEIGTAVDFPEETAEGVETESKIQEYASIKSLIIKTADYAAANSEEFKLSLRSDYVAISDFGEYFETATVDIDGNSVGITQLYSYSAGIRNDMDDVNIHTQTYIKTGLLYYDGVVPVYGVGVGNVGTTVDANGEKVLDRNNLLGTYTADEIAFWYGGSKKAYINATSVYFPSATITGGSINIGNGTFSVSSSGAMTATSANIRGSITATTLDVSNAYIHGDISASNISGGTLNCDQIYIQGLNVTDSMISSLSCSKLYGSLMSSLFAASTIGANCLSGGSCGNYITFNNMYHGGGTLGSGLYVTSSSGNYAYITTSYSSPAFSASGGSGSGTTTIYNMIRAGIWWAQNEGSDIRVKHAVEDLDDRYSAFFDGLKPKRFIYDWDTSGSYRLGFIAQDVRKALESSGLTMQDFGALQVENEGEYTERYYLTKDGMIALNTMEIQKIKERVASLEAALFSLMGGKKGG